uniref:RING-CH-type domain-containing protein n=1 Tax=Oryza nivara TaxID=4536 RepID=A0A0E0FKQ4_ORYNI
MPVVQDQGKATSCRGRSPDGWPGHSVTGRKVEEEEEEEEDEMERDEVCCSCAMRQCRICHEEEEEGCSAMESPCGCSGSLKYAHRGCVQRWCDEKGSTLCEICLQNFEPGYTAPPKKAQPAHVAVTIRESLEVPRPSYEPEDTPLIGEQDYAECAGAAGRSATWCRSVAVTFTAVLLLRHLVAVVTVGAAHQYAFSLLTIYLLRASGILLPFYVVMRLISTVQKGQRQYQLQLLQEQRRNAARMHRLHGQEEQNQHAILVR